MRKTPVFSRKRAFFNEIRQLAILPDLGWSSTFAVDELNFCVRNGNRWDLVAIITGMAIITAFTADINKFSCPLFRGFQSRRLTTAQKEEGSKKASKLRSLKS